MKTRFCFRARICSYRHSLRLRSWFSALVDGQRPLRHAAEGAFAGARSFPSVAMLQPPLRPVAARSHSGDQHHIRSAHVRFTILFRQRRDNDCERDSHFKGAGEKKNDA